MAQNQDELRLMVDGMKTHIRGMGKDMAKQLGQIGERVSPKEQMKAFDAMTPEDWVKLAEEKGVKASDDFQTEMLRRKEQSDAHRKPI